MSHRSPFVALVSLTLLHTIVDTCAILVGPIWGTLQERFALGTWLLFVVLTLQSISPSMSQMLFGYLRDRHDLRWTLWAGPLAAAICMSLLGLANGFVMLALLLLVGGFAIGAYHPEAAVAAGEVLPGQRTRGLSVFMFGGALGLALGPLLSGALVSRFGMRGLLALGPPLAIGAVAFVLLAGFHKNGRKTAEAAPPPTRRSLSEMMAGRGRLAVFILLICSLRLVPNIAMDKVIAFMLQGQGRSPLFIGAVQSTFLGSAAVGMLLMAWKFRSGWERNFLIAAPLVGIPLLAVIGWSGCPLWLFVTLLVPTGLVLWGTTPVMVSYAHQLFPKGAGLASAITMGTAWGTAGLIQSAITSVYAQSAAPQAAFHVCVPFLLVAGLGACLLPAVGEGGLRVESQELRVHSPELRAES